MLDPNNLACWPHRPSPCISHLPALSRKHPINTGDNENSYTFVDHVKWRSNYIRQVGCPPCWHNAQSVSPLLTCNPSLRRNLDPNTVLTKSHPTLPVTGWLCWLPSRSLTQTVYGYTVALLMSVFSFFFSCVFWVKTLTLSTPSPSVCSTQRDETHCSCDSQSVGVFTGRAVMLTIKSKEKSLKSRQREQLPRKKRQKLWKCGYVEWRDGIANFKTDNKLA